jgi:signal transduction histidine kinase
MLQTRLEERAVRVDLSGWRRGLELRVDAHLVEQALHALVLNAVEVTPEGGTVTLSAERVDGAIAMRVEDQGGGMPFDPDPRDLRPGPSTKRFGTGLGIPFAVKVMDVHGGTLRFESRGVTGTRVVITLPA